MVRVELYRPVGMEQEAEVVARLVVNGDQVDLDGPFAHLIDLGMPVMSISEGKIIRFHENPEEWARSLIGAFRAPDLFAQVVADDHPVSEVEEEPVRIQTPVPH